MNFQERIKDLEDKAFKAGELKANIINAKVQIQAIREQLGVFKALLTVISIACNEPIEDDTYDCLPGYGIGVVLNSLENIEQYLNNKLYK
jgi:hypothetical protein